jgi:two-component system chemotaxis sensor kinase CheA
MDDLLPEFLAETNEALADLDLALVKLERVPDDKPTLSLIFRMVHTIKGTCGFLGLPRLERVAHAAENVLGRVRDGELVVTPDVISLVLASLDRIKAIVAGLGVTGSEPAGDDTAIIAALNRAAAGEPSPVAGESLPAAGASPPAAGATPPAAGANPPAAGATPPAAGANHASEPHAAAPPAADQAKAAPAAEPQDRPAPEPSAESQAGPQTIRVTVDVLEDLMTLVGELVLTRNQLLQLSRAQGTTAFSAPLQRLSHITSDLQEGVMKTRMQPIGNAWNKLPRLVRDLAQETGKKIVIEMRGQDTELDRQVLELMRDPLTHMVRNSADHGLETPEDRRAAGKPESGRIMLNAYHEGGHILIEVADDGRGLDVGRIREKALSKGLATEAELALMTETQIRAFIFRAGFSTAAAVTAISGRGVGMDVVRSNIERIGGTIELASTFGAGSCFTIKIPLTLAIVSALIVSAAGERFAIPQISVMELVRIGRDDAAETAANTMAVEHIGDTPVLRLRDRLLPLVSLGTLLRLGEGQAKPDSTTVVVTAVGSGLLGIVVDEVFDTEEIVVKPVAPILRHVTMFSGNTILGDGSVIMILDPNGVARSAGVASRGSGSTGDAVIPVSHSEERVALLLFRANAEPTPLVVPLSLVARLEEIPVGKIEASSGGYVTQYRGRLMPLIAMDAGGFVPGSRCRETVLLAEPGSATEATQPVLVFADGERSMGLMVDAILDVVHDRLRIEIGGTRPGLFGTAVIGGQAADVLDTGHWLTLAWRDWFGGNQETARPRQRILVVEDSTFFRQLLVPTLSAAGYEVTAAGSAAEALRLRDAGLQVDAIVSDIEMPDMDGLAFARIVRDGGAWASLPMIALTARGGALDAEAGRAAGFTDYVQKMQREALIESLRQCLGSDTGLLETEIA